MHLFGCLYCLFVNEFGSFPVVPSCVPLDKTNNVFRAQRNLAQVKRSLEETPSLLKIQTRNIAIIKQIPTCENSPSAKT